MIGNIRTGGDTQPCSRNPTQLTRMAADASYGEMFDG